MDELTVSRVPANSGGDGARLAVNGGNKQSALASGALNINSVLVAVTVVGTVTVVVAEDVLNCVGYEFRVCAHGVHPLLVGLLFMLDVHGVVCKPSPPLIHPRCLRVNRPVFGSRSHWPTVVDIPGAV